jgi:asparagine synthase (glutamine-hydrolysing)
MAACLEHRGPDAAGDWSDASGVVAFGFRRLAVLDLSDAGNQPMTSPDGRFAIMLNGEIWTVLMFQAWLAESGGMYRTSGT